MQKDTTATMSFSERKEECCFNKFGRFWDRDLKKNYSLLPISVDLDIGSVDYDDMLLNRVITEIWQHH